MSTSDGRRELRFHYVLDCPCGTTLTGVSEDDIVEVSLRPREKHPDMADYERAHPGPARRVVP